MAKTKSKKSPSLGKVIAGMPELTPALLGRTAAWIIIPWICIAFGVATWTNRTKYVVPGNTQYKVLNQLKQVETNSPSDYSQIQNLRATLILEYLQSGQLVAGRTELKKYLEFLEQHKDLPLKQMVEMRNQLAIVHIALEDNDSAIAQYNLILRALEKETDYQSRLTRAQMLNDIGIAYYLRSQQFDRHIPSHVGKSAKTPDRVTFAKHYLSRAKSSFQACSEILNQLYEEHPVGDKKREDLKQALEENLKFYNFDLLFTPEQARPS